MKKILFLMLLVFLVSFGVALAADTCTDDDPDNDPFVFGTVVLSDGTTYEDYCTYSSIGPNFVEQYSCDGESVSLETFSTGDFSYTSLCIDGIVTGYDHSDSETTSPYSYLEFGIINQSTSAYGGSSWIIEDNCTSDMLLVEYFINDTGLGFDVLGYIPDVNCTEEYGINYYCLDKACTYSEEYGCSKENSLHTDFDGDGGVGIDGSCDIDGDEIGEYRCGCFTRRGNFRAISEDESCPGFARYMCELFSEGNMTRDRCEADLGGTYYEADAECVAAFQSRLAAAPSAGGFFSWISSVLDSIGI